MLSRNSRKPKSKRKSGGWAMPKELTILQALNY